MKRTLSLMLSLLLSTSARADDAGVLDAGVTDVPLALSVESADLVLDDGLHTHQHVDGGAWMNDALIMSLGKSKASEAAEKKVLQEAAPVLPAGVVIALSITAVIAFGLGVTSGIEGCKLFGCAK